MPHLPAALVRWEAATPGLSFAQTRFDPQRGIMLASGAATGSVTGPIHAAQWSQAIPSWRAVAPANTMIEVWLRAEIAARWTRWYSLGVWSQAARHSVDDQDDADASVATDTLQLTQSASALQWRVDLHSTTGSSPQLYEIAVALSPHAADATDEPAIHAIAPLPVPQLSQMIYPGGGPVWCSPTSLTMLLAYWAEQTHAPQLAPFNDPQAVPDLVAPGVFDAVYDGTGNWPFNTAFAAALGLRSYVAQLSGLSEAATWLAAGVPLIASIRWQAGELDGAPVAHSNGHLVVIVGFTERGDVIVNDPAADPRNGAAIRRVYSRTQFRTAWQHSGRMVYLICPLEYIDALDA